MGSQSSGFEQAAHDLVGEIPEPEGRPVAVLEPAVDVPLLGRRWCRGGRRTRECRRRAASWCGRACGSRRAAGSPLVIAACTMALAFFLSGSR